jgi:serine O-acetyltransferase
MNSNAGNAVDELLQTYSETGGINYIDLAATLPSREPIEAACRELMGLMFPGFHGGPLIDSGDLPAVTRSRMKNLHAELKPELCKSFGRLPATAETEKKAEDLLAFFIGELPRIRRLLWTDIDAAYEGDPAAKGYEEVILAYPAIEAIAIQRMAHLLYEKEVPLIPRMMTELAHAKTGIDIHPGARIGPGFFIDHGTGVVIGETCDIGVGVKLYQGVTLGALSFTKEDDGSLAKGAYKRHPTLEDGVVVYANATILGGQTVIGTRAVVGSNVWLTESVPPDTTVVLEKPKLRLKGAKPNTEPLTYEI